MSLASGAPARRAAVAADSSLGPRPAFAMAFRRPSLPLGPCVAIVVALAARGFAQDSVLPAVADSATASQWVRQMAEQARENPAESARLAQRLLDGYAGRLVPTDEPAGDRFENVRLRTNRFLLERPAVLERYRAAESGEAARSLAAGAVEETAANRALTPAGLRATLILAERDWRAGRFEAAESRLAALEGHPDLRGDEAAAYWFHRGAVAIVRRDPARAKDAAARLGNLDAPAWSEALAAAAALAPRAATPARPEDLPRDGWQLLWREELTGTPYARAFLRPTPAVGPFVGIAADRRVREAAERNAAPYNTTLPVAAGDLVLVNDGDRLRALDRFGRRERWSRALIDRPDGMPEIGGPIGDLSTVAVSGDVAVAYAGEVVGMERRGGGTVVAVDLATGRERWRVALPSLGGEDFARLYPIGAPLVVDGVVHILARRVTPRFENVEYLVALALDDGRPLGSTFLCSAGGVRLSRNRPCAAPVAVDGAILVATPGGGVGRVDPTDGRLAWFRRFLVPIRDLRYPSEAWELATPAVAAGSVFAIVPDQTEVVRLDLEDGRTIAGYPIGGSTAWGQPRYLLGDGERVYAVGADLRAFDPDAADRPLWSFAEVNAARLAAMPEATNRSGIRGRVQSAGGLLAVPHAAGVFLVSADTGRIEGEVALDGPGNPIVDVAGEQLLVAGPAELVCLMPGDSAERVMRNRVASRPDDPRAALALLELAVRAGNATLALEAARMAGDALERSTDDRPDDRAADRDELVSLLLSVADAPGTAGAIRADLFAEARAASRTPVQLARERLAEASWHAGDGRTAAAVALLREVWSDPAYAAVEIDAGGGRIVPAPTLAMETLDALPPEAFRAAAPGVPPMPGEERWIAERSSRAAEASPHEALATLGELWRWLPADARGDRALPLVLEAGASVGRRAGWTGHAEAIADAAWAARSGAGSPPFPRPEPAIGIDGPVREFPGRLPPTTDLALAEAPLDGFPLLEKGELVWRTVPEFEIAWRLPLSHRTPLVLAYPPGGIAVWEEDRDGANTVVLLDRATGQVRSRTPVLSSFVPMELSNVPGANLPPSLTSQRPFFPSEALPFADRERLVLVLRDGSMAAFRWSDLARPEWTAAGTLERIDIAERSAWGLLLAGHARSERGEPIPTVVLVDPASGAIIGKMPFAEDVRWARVGAFGEAVVGTDSAVLGIDPIRGRRLWSRTGPTGQGTLGGWIVGDRVVVSFGGGRLEAMRLRDGRIDEVGFRRPGGAPFDGNFRDLDRIGEGFLVHCDKRLSWFGLDGNLLGEDAISDDRDFRMALPVTGGLLVLNAMPVRMSPAPAGFGNRPEYPYLMYLLERPSGLRLAGAAREIRIPGQPIQSMVPVDGFLIASGEDATIAVPVAPAP